MCPLWRSDICLHRTHAQIENPTDDPRDFHMTDPANWEDGPIPADMDAFLSALYCPPYIMFPRQTCRSRAGWSSFNSRRTQLSSAYCYIFILPHRSPN